MKSVSDIDLDYKAWMLLEQTANTIFEAREAGLREYNNTAMQVAVLSIVKSIGDEATPAEIARWLLRRPHTVSGLLNRMEKAGLVRKTKNLHKKNLVRVTLTPKGEQSYKQSLKNKSIHRIMSALTAKEREQLMSYLRKLRDKALKEAGINPKKVPFPAK